MNRQTSMEDLAALRQQRHQQQKMIAEQHAMMNAQMFLQQQRAFDSSRNQLPTFPQASFLPIPSSSSSGARPVPPAPVDHSMYTSAPMISAAFVYEDGPATGMPMQQSAVASQRVEMRRGSLSLSDVLPLMPARRDDDDDDEQDEDGEQDDDEALAAQHNPHHRPQRAVRARSDARRRQEDDDDESADEDPDDGDDQDDDGDDDDEHPTTMPMTSSASVSPASSPAASSGRRRAVGAAYVSAAQSTSGGRRDRRRPSAHRTFACEVQHCNRVFRRSEHLKRHERTHSGEKPFACTEPNCKKSTPRTFSRAF